MSAIKGIFAKEINQAIVLSSEKDDESKVVINNEKKNTTSDSAIYKQKNPNKPNLRVVK